jgi:hypothetical protein
MCIHLHIAYKVTPIKYRCRHFQVLPTINKGHFENYIKLLPETVKVPYTLLERTLKLTVIANKKTKNNLLLHVACNESHVNV